MSKRERIAYLVGAGLATDADLPMSVELATKLRESLEQASDNEKLEGSNKLARPLLSLYRFLNGGVRFQEGCLDRDPDKPVNIEQIAVAALSLKYRQLDPIAPYTSGWHQRISEFEASGPNINAGI